MIHRTQLLLDQVGAFQRAGRWGAGLAVCERVYQESIKNRNGTECLEIILRTAFLYNAKGDRALATEQFELALTIADLSLDDVRAARALNGLGVLHQGSGDIDLASQYYIQAKQRSEIAEDRLVGGDIELNMGIVANIQGDLEDALQHYELALKEYESIGHRSRLAKVLNNLGMLYIDLSQYERAYDTLERGLNICRSIGDLATEGIIHANRTELFIARGNLDAARISCDEAYELSSRLRDDNLRTDVLKCYGIIYRETNRPHLSESHLLQAVQLASSLGNVLIEAEAHRELFLVYRGQDRNREALQALNSAHRLFSSLQAKLDQDDVSKRISDLEGDFLSLVARWGESIEEKDHYTSGHCRRVADYACRLAAAAGLQKQEMPWFRMGAFLHDVGKTEVPEYILNKPGPLTSEERRTIEYHTIAGDDLLASIQFPWDVRPMVRSHHERWDGEGYPDNLAGEEIPFTARILHIADVFDALTTDRSYRGALSATEALDIMMNDGGSFDPRLLALFRMVCEDTF